MCLYSGDANPAASSKTGLTMPRRETRRRIREDMSWSLEERVWLNAVAR